LVFAALACGARGDDAGDLPTAAIHVGNHRLTVEVAATPAARARGLMFRKELPEDRGMLFVFPDERVLDFWMRNTEIPLSIAFAEASGRIVRIADMEPRSEALVSSGAPARYALEVNRGWYATHGVQSGDSLGHLPATPAE
jgi:uncharacterized membrane protein (UPF0127 family)